MPNYRTAMRYYLYLSRKKLNMLSAQLPARRRLDVTAKVNIGVAPVSGEVGATTSFGVDRDDHATLEQTIRAIKADGLVGAIDSPSVWFEDYLDVRWGFFPPDAPELVFFGGEKHGTLLGLTGSVASLVNANQRQVPVLDLASMDVGFIRAMKEVKARNESWENHSPPARSDVFDVVERMVSQCLSGAPQRVGFLAKRLSTGATSSRRPAVLATPLYVELL